MRRTLGVAVLSAVLALGGTVHAQVAQSPAPAPREQPGDGVPQQGGAATETRSGLPSLAPLVERVRASVVGVTSHMRPGASGGKELDPLRRFFGGGPDQGPGPGGGGGEGSPFGGDNSPGGDEVGVGSGVIVDPSGIVVTNNHVIQGAEEVTVKTADEQEYKAKVLGADPDTDVAVLQIQGLKTKLQAAQFGNSDNVRVGDFLVAIGSPFGLELTVTSGILSAKKRVIGAGPYDDFLQTDAAINPGNSGGPLFDLSGRVVGINTAIVASGQGIGFAVPVDLVKALLPQLIKNGKVVRGYIGVAIQDLTPDLAKAFNLNVSKGALVGSVEPKGPAAKAGLKPGDLITSVNNVPVSTATELSRRISLMAPGTQAQLKVMRGGTQQTVNVTLATKPGNLSKKAAPEQEENQTGPLGLRVKPVPKDQAETLGIDHGALVVGVDPGSRAARGGLSPGDVIFEANQKDIRTPKDLVNIKNPNGQILMHIMREGRAFFVVVPATTGPNPDKTPAG